MILHINMDIIIMLTINIDLKEGSTKIFQQLCESLFIDKKISYYISGNDIEMIESSFKINGARCIGSVAYPKTAIVNFKKDPLMDYFKSKNLIVDISSRKTKIKGEKQKLQPKEAEPEIKTWIIQIEVVNKPNETFELMCKSGNILKIVKKYFQTFSIITEKETIQGTEGNCIIRLGLTYDGKIEVDIKMLKEQLEALVSSEVIINIVRPRFEALLDSMTDTVKEEKVQERVVDAGKIVPDKIVESLKRFLTKEKEIEIELSIGSYFGKSFNPGVDKERFQEIQTKLLKDDRFRKEYSHTIVRIDNKNIRAIKNVVTGKIKLELKIRNDEKIENAEWGYRISKSMERPATDKQGFISVVRERRRTRFITNSIKQLDGFAIDMSTVKQMDTGKPQRNEKYEVEMEIIDISVTAEKFKTAIVYLFELMQGTHPISSTEEKEVIHSYNKLFFGTGARYGGNMASKFNKPVNISVKDLIDQNLNTEYAVTEKLDGTRYLLFFTDTGVYLIRPEKYVRRVGNAIKITNTILDGEFVNKADTFFVFDVMFIQGKDVRPKKFIDRISLVDMIDWKTGTINMVVKNFINTSNFYQNINEGFKIIEERNRNGLDTDGLIIQPLNVAYDKNSNGSNKSLWKPTLKWKPIEKLTIDFKLRMVGKDMFELHASGEENKTLKFVGTRQEPYDKKVIISEGKFEGVPVDGTIMEFKWDSELQNFVPTRFRSDRQSPNHISVILGTSNYGSGIWRDIMNPLTEQDIRGKTLKVVRRLHNKIKDEMLNVFKSDSTIFDIGSGRGGDLFKWIKKNINVYGVDPDQDNLDELYKRLEKIDDIQVNLSFENIGAQNTDEVVRFVGGNLIDGITSFFSLTFFPKNEEMYDGLINTIDRITKDGGSFVGTVLDGNAVRKLLGESSSYKNESFEIVKVNEFTDSPFENTIMINLFDKTTMVKNQVEYLVDFDYLRKRLEKLGFRLIKNEMLGRESNKEVKQVNQILKTFSQETTISQALKTFSGFPNRLTLAIISMLEDMAQDVGEELDAGLVGVGRRDDIIRATKKLIDGMSGLDVSMLPDDSQVFSSLNRKFIFLRKGTEETKEKKRLDVDQEAPVSLFRTKYIRIGTINDRSNIFHAILKQFHDYEHMNIVDRTRAVTDIRKSISDSLSMEEYNKLDEGLLAIYNAQEYRDRLDEEKSIVAGWFKYRIDLIDRWDEISMLELVSNVLDTDIYILDSTTMNPVPVKNCKYIYKGRKSIILFKFQEDYYEIMGKQIEDKVSVIFNQNDQIIQKLRKKMCT